MASCAATLKEAEEEHYQYVAALIIVNSKVLSMRSSEGARNEKAIMFNPTFYGKKNFSNQQMIMI